MTETSALFVPATPVPVASKIRCVLRYDNEMANSHLDETVTSGARVRLAGLIRLNRMYDEVLECAEGT